MPELVFLGVGGWLSNPFFGQSGILVMNSGLKILVDVGEGAFERLSMCFGIKVDELDYVIVTHSHGDHVLGLPTIAQHLKRALKVIALRETAADIRKIFEALHVEDKLQRLDVIEIPPEGVMKLKSGALLRWVKAKHVIPSISIMLELGAFKIAYSGDTSLNPDFLEMVKGADLLIHEFSVPDAIKDVAEALGHTTTSEINQIIKISRPKRLMPVHYYLEPPKFSLKDLGRVELILPTPCSKFNF